MIKGGSAGLRMLGDVNMNRRNMIIIALSLGIGLGLKAVPDAVQHVPATIRMLLTTGLLPAAFLAIVLNMVLPEEVD